MLVQVLFAVASLVPVPASESWNCCGGESFRYALKYAPAEIVVAEVKKRFQAAEVKVPVSDPPSDPRAAVARPGFRAPRRGPVVDVVAIPASNEVLAVMRTGAAADVLKFVKQLDAAYGPTTP